MQKWLLGLAAVAVSMPVYGLDWSGHGNCSSCNPCTPKPKYVTVKVLEKKLVPVKSYECVTEEVECTVYEKVAKEVPVTVQRTFWEDKEIKVRKQVLKDVEKTIKVVTNTVVEEEATREVYKCVPETFEKEVTRCTYVKQCDPCTGRSVKVPLQYVEKIPVTIYNKVAETQTYTVKKIVPEISEKTITVKVCDWEEATATVKVAVCRDVEETRTVYEKVATTVLKPVTKKVPVTTYKEVVKCVKKKVLAETPCDTAAPFAEQVVVAETAKVVKPCDK